MRYAGFWVRFVAGCCDFLVFIPILAIYIWIESRGYTGSLLIVIPYFLTYALYCIFFLTRCGQTPGKMIARIRVVRLDGARISFREAALRHSVDFAFALAAGIGMLIAIHRAGPSVFTPEYTWFARNQIVVPNMPRLASIAQDLSNVWICSEMVVLLFNKKRRAIHDFIAGTVVIHVEKTGGHHAVAGCGSRVR
jgi:uncharacterized RDD family membrane protein YckC